MQKNLYILKHFAISKKLFFYQYLSFSDWFPLILKHWSPLAIRIHQLVKVSPSLQFTQWPEIPISVIRIYTMTRDPQSPRSLFPLSWFMSTVNGSLPKIRIHPMVNGSLLKIMIRPVVRAPRPHHQDSPRGQIPRPHHQDSPSGQMFRAHYQDSLSGQMPRPHHQDSHSGQMPCPHQQDSPSGCPVPLIRIHLMVKAPQKDFLGGQPQWLIITEIQIYSVISFPCLPLTPPPPPHPLQFWCLLREPRLLLNLS